MGYLRLEQKVNLDTAFIENTEENNKSALDVKWADLGKKLKEEGKSLGKNDEDDLDKTQLIDFDQLQKSEEICQEVARAMAERERLNNLSYIEFHSLMMPEQIQDSDSGAGDKWQVIIDKIHEKHGQEMLQQKKILQENMQLQSNNEISNKYFHQLMNKIRERMALDKEGQELPVSDW